MSRSHIGGLGLALLALLALGSCVGGSETTAANRSGRVLILGLDGARSEGLELANLPSIDRIRASGDTDLDAVTGNISLSGPGWSSMLTGVWCDKHNVVDNSASWGNSAFDVYPHFITRVEQIRPELKTASVVHWAPINDEILCADERFDNCGRADTVISKSTDAGVRDEVVDLLTKGDPDVVFVQFDDIDHAGHGGPPQASQPGGFCPKPAGSLDGGCLLRGLNPDYLSEFQRIDGYVGEIMTALQRRPNYQAENWLVLMSPDHGGGGTLFNQHGFPSAQDRRTFFVVSGSRTAALPGQPARRLDDLPSAAGNALPPVDLSGAKIVDIAATALFHLRIAIDPRWGLDGQPVGLPGVPAYEERAVPSCISTAAFTADDRPEEDGNAGDPEP